MYWWEVLGVSELYVKKFYHHHNWAMDIIVHSTVVQQCADLLNVKFNLRAGFLQGKGCIIPFCFISLKKGSHYFLPSIALSSKMVHKTSFLGMFE